MQAERFSFPREQLRTRAARGALINGSFLLVVEALGLVQAVVVARLLDPDQVGLYGIVSVTVMTILALKQVGIDEAYVQQESDDQQLAFQRAFTIDLLLSAGFALLIAIAAPAVGALYHDAQLVPMMIALGLLPLLFALQSPAWIFLRRMDFLRQRMLQSVVPIVTFASTVGLILAGLGAWGLVVGALLGNLAAGIVSATVSPYPIRMAVHGATIRHYLGFSAPIFLAAACGLIIRQGQTFAFDRHLGLAGAGYLTLSIAVTRYADRADQLITQTIYPAICAIKDSPSRMAEAFEKSNRLTAMWALPIGAGMALFANDLVVNVLGSKWEPAVTLLQLIGVSTAIYQLGFNWTAFHRAVGRTRPQTIYALAGLVVFLAVPLPLLFVYGSTGFAWGLFGVNLVAGLLRWRYMKALLPSVRIARYLARSVIPPLAACVPVLAWRLIAGSGDSAQRFAAEAMAFLITYCAVTALSERELLGEALGYLTSRQAPEPVT